MKNKKNYIYILGGLSLFVSIVKAETCDGLLTYEAALLLNEIINYVRIGVPVLLIVLCAIDFFGVVTSGEDDAMKKATSKVVKRFIAAAAFFFVPLLIKFVLGLDAVKNSLKLVDDPTCGIGTLTDEEIKDEYKTQEEIEKEEEEKKQEEVYEKELYHSNTINGVRYLLYNQVDSRWKDIPYGNSTLGVAGCPVIASSVIISAYNNKITPADVVKTNPHSYPATSVEAYANDGFDCQMIRPSKYKSMRDFLADGNVAVIHIKGPNAGGYNKFVPGNHYMALIDYDKRNDRIFVGNAFGSSGYARSGWFDATTVLTSPSDTHYCIVKQSLIDKHKTLKVDF